MKNNANAITQTDIHTLRGAIFIVASTKQDESRLECYDLIAIPEGGVPSGVVHCGHTAAMHRPRVGFVGASIQINGNNPLWKTVVDMLKPSDRITLRWIADSQSRVMEAHGLGLDELHVEVSRPGTPQPFTFAITLQGFAMDGDAPDRMVQTAAQPGPGPHKTA